MFLQCSSPGQIQLLRNLEIWQKVAPRVCSPSETESELLLLFFFSALHSFLAAESQIRGRGIKTKQTQKDDDSRKSRMDPLCDGLRRVGCAIGGVRRAPLESFPVTRSL